MFRPLVAVAAIVILAAGFSQLPSDDVGRSYTFTCPTSPAEREEARERNRREELIDPSSAARHRGVTLDLDTLETKPYDGTPDFTSHEVHKSGLRQAIEGRLHWLGVEHALDFLDNRTCS